VAVFPSFADGEKTRDKAKAEDAEPHCGFKVGRRLTTTEERVVVTPMSGRLKKSVASWRLIVSSL
jgi:hypothetical protein